jgi:hypothetical protein
MSPCRWQLGLLAAGIVAAACGPSFDPYNRLNSLRVLAIRSEPVAPAVGETTTIDAKVYAPSGETVTYAWSWCPFATAAGAPCPISEADILTQTGATVSYDLPTSADGTTTFTNDIPTTLFEALCAGMPGLTAPDCTDGFPIEIKLTVTSINGDQAQTDQVQAVRPLRLRFRDTDQPNLNPGLCWGDVPADGCTTPILYAVLAGTTQALDGTPTLPRHVKTQVGTALIDADSESYNGKDNDGNPARVRERLNLSWFVESGDTDHQRTAFIDGSVTLDAASSIKWTPAFKKDYAPTTSRVVVIMRDDREGVSWTEGSANLEDMP